MMPDDWSAFPTIEPPAIPPSGTAPPGYTTVSSGNGISIGFPSGTASPSNPPPQEAAPPSNSSQGLVPQPSADEWDAFPAVPQAPPTLPPEQQPASSTLGDVIEGIPGAMARGFSSAASAMGKAAAAEQSDPELQAEIPGPEESERILEKNVTGPLYQSQTPTGKAISAGIEAVTAGGPASFMGPAGAARALAATFASGVGSYEAGEAANKVAPQSPGLRTAAELAGGLISPMAGEMLGTGVRALRPAPRPPEIPQTMGMTFSAGEATGDNALRQGESAAYSGQLGVPAQQHAQQFFDVQRPQEQARAKQFIGERMGAPETVANPAEAADVIADELAAQKNNNDLAVRNQGAGITKQITDFKDRLSPTNSPLAANPMEAANHIQGAVANEAERAQATTNAAYDTLRNTPGNFHPATFNNIGEVLTRKLRAGPDPTIINPQTTPQANAAINDLDDVLSGLKQTRDPDTGRVVPRPPITPQVVENARKRLNTFYGDALASARSSNNWSDVRATRQVMNAFDNYVENRLGAGTFMNGDPSAVIDAMKQARAAHANFRKTFTRQGTGDVVGPAIQKILGQWEGQAATPEEVKGILYGNGGLPVKVGQRLIQMFGADSPEIGAIKQGLVSNILERPPGQKEWTAEQVADRIDAATKGPGSTLTRTYLAPNEIAELQEIGGNLRNYHERTNPSPNPVDKIFAGIVGEETRGRAANKDIRRSLFESVMRGGRESENMQNTLRQRLTPRGWTIYKKGLFLHAAEPVEGIPDWGPKKTGDRLYTLLDATRNTKTFNPVERALIKTYADVMRKITIPKLGVANWSNTAPLLIRGMRTMGTWAGRLIGIKVAEALFGHSLLSEAAGIAGAEMVGRSSSRVEARRVMKQLPLAGEQLQRYYRAVNAYKTNHSVGTEKLVTTALANLTRSLRDLGLDTSTMPQPPLNEPASKATGGAIRNRDDGGPIITDDPPPDSDNPWLTVPTDASGRPVISITPRPATTNSDVAAQGNSSQAPITPPEAPSSQPLTPSSPQSFNADIIPSTTPLNLNSSNFNDLGPIALKTPINGPGDGSESPPSQTPDQGMISHPSADMSVSGTVPVARSILDKLLGIGGPRYELWPERLIRSGFSAPGDVLATGQSTERDPYGRVIGAEPEISSGPTSTDILPQDIYPAGFPTQSAIQKSQDIAGLQFSGGAGAAEEGAVGMAGGRPTMPTRIVNATAQQLPKLRKWWIDQGGQIDPDGNFIAYHGTHSGAADSIEQKGIIPGYGQGADAWAKEYHDTDYGLQNKATSLAPDLGTAEGYAHSTSELHNDQPLVYQVRIPPQDFIKAGDEAHAETTIYPQQIISKNIIPSEDLLKTEAGKPVMPERIAGPAYRAGDQIYSAPFPKWHGDVIEDMPEGLPDNNTQEGFVTNTGRFVDRNEAAQIANANDQVRSEFEGHTPNPNELHAMFLKTEAGKPGTALAALENTAPLYSAVERAVSNAKQAKASPEQWIGWLKNQPGVKSDELQQLGLSDKSQLPPDLQKGPITKDQLLNHIKENQIQLNTIEKSGEPSGDEDEAFVQAQAAVQRDFERRFPYDPPEAFDHYMETTEAEAALAHYMNQYLRESEGPRFSDYQLPGGENYRETLLTLPQREPLTAYSSSDYYSTHWPNIPNPLLHLRMNDREIPGVGKDLHLEELQSDWHEAGHKHGYDDPVARAATKKLEAANYPLSDEDAVLAMRNGILTPEEARSFTLGSIPNAPFKNLGWVDLGLKTAIGKAAREGYDAISWTPGEQQTDRYNLSKKIDNASYDTKTNMLRVFLKDQYTASPNLSKRLTPEELPSYIGKEAADRILNNPSDKAGSMHYLNNAGFKVGGEWTKNLYDKTLVNKANDIGKKYGARVEWKEMPGSAGAKDFDLQPSGNLWKLVDRDTGERVGPLFGSGGDAEKWIAQNRSIKIPVLRLTPALKAAALKGLPLYSEAGKPGAALAAIKREPEGAGIRTLHKASQINEDSIVGDDVDLQLYGRKYGLDDEELTKLIKWIDNPGALRTNADFDKIMNKLPTYSGTIYRGVLLSGSALDKLKVGSIFPNLRNTSATKDPVVANLFEGYAETRYHSGENKTLLEMNQKSARDLSGLNEDEQEVVIPKGTRYKVEAVVPEEINNWEGKHTIYKIKLRELDRTSQNQNRRSGGRVNVNPTSAQQKAGNYAKRHTTFAGLDISIENEKGSQRKGIGKDGKPWSVTMPAAYGYLKRTEGKDGDQVDVYLGPHKTSPKVFVIDQIKADDKSFDEHKVMLGFGSKTQAIAYYKKAFSDGKGLDRLGAIHELTIPQLKDWLKRGDTKAPLKDGGIVPVAKHKKITRDAFLYMEPEGDNKVRQFAQCSTCFLLTVGKCLIHGPDVKITPDMTCALYVPGPPQKQLAGQEKTLVTPEVSGLVRGQVRCENCQYTAGNTSDDQGCGLYRMLNQRQPDDFDLDPKIAAHGCCNAWTARA